MWLDAGFELGNHTYAHTSLNGGGLKAFEDGVIQGENVTRLLMTQHHQTLRYFRHPYLDTGRDLKTRREAEQFLIERGYHIAPVTMDAWDWMFAGIYDDAKRRGDTALQQQVVKSYLDYTTEVFTYFEKLSRDLFGYEPKTDSADARQQSGGGAHRRSARSVAQARLQIPSARRSAERFRLQFAGHLCWR